MLLRRSKSGDLGKATRKAQALKEAELEREREREAALRVAPKLPDFANIANNTERLSHGLPRELQPSEPTYSLSNSGGSGGFYIRASPPEPRSHVSPTAPSMPVMNNVFDPYARTESMTNRGRHSYASSAISISGPRRMRRRKDPTPFNILVIGTKGSGKTSFVEFLKTALTLPIKKRPKKFDDDEFRMPAPASGNFIPHYVETEMDNERIGVTLWDSEGIEKNLVDLQLRELTAFLESKFEETFTEEMKVIRSPGVQDSHVHAIFLVLDPARLDRNVAAASRDRTNGFRPSGGYDARVRTSGALDEDLDLQILRTLNQKTTIIPVITKADTITTKHMNVLKKSVWESIKKAGLDPLEPLGLDDEVEGFGQPIGEEEDSLFADHYSSSSSTQSPPTSPVRRHKALDELKEDEVPALPLSIISPDLYEPGVIGRQFPWGFADPYNDQHCDFTRLREAVFSDWRSELREASREQWYENWRTNRLKLRDLPYRHR